jgi:hypothetical protein
MPKHVEARGIVAGISEEAMQIIAGMLEVMEQPDMDFLEGWEEAL